MPTVSRETLPEKKLVCTHLKSHRDGRNGEKRLGQYVSSSKRREVASEAAGCLSGIKAGFEEKYVLGPGRCPNVPRAEPIVTAVANRKKRCRRAKGRQSRSRYDSLT